MTEETQTAEPAIGASVMAQVAFVVPDVAKVAATYAELLGVDEPEIREPPPREGRQYLGEPLPPEINIKIAMIELDNITLELIEPVGGPSVWRDALPRDGVAFHHIAFAVEDGDRAADALAARGYPTLHSEIRANGGRMAYVDARTDLGALLELLGGPPQG